MTPDLPTLYAVIEATWPPAARRQVGPFMLRDGAGGGQRVSAATLEGALQAGAIEEAAAAMRAQGQPSLFMVRQDEDTFDAALEERGYVVKDPVHLYLCPIDLLTDQPIPRVTAFSLWEPLNVMREIWQEGGIGPARIAVMARAAGPKTAILGRRADKPAGAAFVAIHDRIAMVHALEIKPEHRGQGLGKWMMRKAAFWARAEGAEWMSVLCTTANEAACGLYASLGMTRVGQYHYRIKADAPEETAAP